MHTGSYLDGAWYHPTSETQIENHNPADARDVIATFPGATPTCVERAVAGAQRAQAAWRKVPAPARGRVMARAAELARGRIDELARTLTREQGKTLAEAKGEVQKGINVLEFYAGEGFRIAGRTLPSESEDVFTYTLRRPLGVVASITPWNFPWAIPVWKAAPALVAGNAVVFKPSEFTPATGAAMVDIFTEAGLPAGCLQMLVGTGEEVGAPLVDHPAIAAVSFTGSNAVGKQVYAAAAKRGAKVTCELGGKNALIAMADADVDQVVGAVLNGAFGSAGQRCTATSRLLVHRSLKDAVLERVVAGAKALSVGPGLEGADMGPLVNQRQLDQVLRYMEQGKSEAKLVMGGGRVETLPHGYFPEPTVFDEVTPGMAIFQEEIFGPVLSVATFETYEQALTMANGVEYGLACSLYTQNFKDAMRFVEEAEVGMVHVNEPTVGGEAQLPFGGLKSTGIGDREMSTDGLNFFTETKTVFLNFASGPSRNFVR